MRPLLLLLVSAAMTVLGAVSSALPAAADDVVKNTVLLLLDTSGSMADEDGTGTIKIEGAKAGISSLVNSLPATARVGLMTYPGTGDCGKPKTVAAIAKLDSATLTRGVSGLPTPNGGTPTADALRAAAEAIRSDGHDGTIVLVSDGHSNCEGDPCAVAKEIAAAGVDLTVNTVGFSIDQAGRDELECIANATNGRYADVTDGDQLGDELAQQMTPVLTLATQIPGNDIPVNATSVPVSAIVTNSSGLTAVNVQVILVPATTGTLLGVLRPFMSLGNLAAGESRTVTWAVQVSHLVAGQKASLRIRAQAANAKAVSAEGVLSFVEPGGSMIGSSSALSGFTRAAVLGDSFSAGDGAETALTAYSDQECRRSSKQYVHRLLAQATVDNFACTGAVTSDLTAEGASQHPSQLQQLTNALNAGHDYDVVFVTIGGNDIGFADIATNCLAQHMLVGFSKGAGYLPFLNPCAADPDSVLYAPEMELIDAQKQVLQGTYWQIAQRFVNAGRDVPPIIVSPYPLMTPYDVGLRWSCGKFFSFTNAGFGLDQLAEFTNLQRRLNAVIQQAVTDAHDSDGVPVYFAGPVEMAMQPGHTLCSDDSWIVRVTIGNARGGTADTAMHPNADGHLAIALALSRWSETPGLTLSRVTPGQRGGYTLLDAAPVGTVKANSGGWVTSGPADFVMDGLAPHSLLLVTIRSSPYPLLYGVADANGHYTGRVLIDPRLVPPGAHQLVLGVVNAQGIAEVRSVAVTVTRPVPYWYWAVALLGGMLLGVGLVARRRRRRSTVSPG